ncbi:hypothetical protein [Dyadobacter sp. CY323]|uniref:hypothetical protein n=1 Tax=Dyadobacter sp. CY323 TaxID=2907302 RepID=UPI001F41AD1D|nr:hypothetical protein [Dyadobacter sp. CY323]MCE6987551.1 hypothetical protein [Dyadobacter sp. CY323]
MKAGKIGKSEYVFKSISLTNRPKVITPVSAQLFSGKNTAKKRELGMLNHSKGYYMRDDFSATNEDEFPL